MSFLLAQIKRFFVEEEGPTFLEYALLLIAIALVVVVAAATFGNAVRQMFEGADGGY